MNAIIDLEHIETKNNLQLSGDRTRCVLQSWVLTSVQLCFIVLFICLISICGVKDNFPHLSTSKVIVIIIKLSPFGISPPSPSDQPVVHPGGARRHPAWLRRLRFCVWRDAAVGVRRDGGVREIQQRPLRAAGQWCHVVLLLWLATARIQKSFTSWHTSDRLDASQN